MENGFLGSMMHDVFASVGGGFKEIVLLLCSPCLRKCTNLRNIFGLKPQSST